MNIRKPVLLLLLVAVGWLLGGNLLTVSTHVASDRQMKDEPSLFLHTLPDEATYPQHDASSHTSEQQLSQFLTSSPAKTSEKFLMFNNLYSWYSLTNMMMCYAAALRYGVDAHRTVVFPVNMTANFFELFDANETQRALRGVVTIRHPNDVPQSAMPPFSMNKHNMFLPERFVFHSAPFAERSQKYMKAMNIRSEKYIAIRHHNFFMRFPWVSSMKPHDESFFMRAFVFAPVIRQTFDGVRSKLPAKYLALHLRLEADSKLLRPVGASSPSHVQLRSFFTNSIIPIVKSAKLSAIYLCTGELTEVVSQLIDNWNHAALIPITHRKLLVDNRLVSLPVATGQQRESHKAKQGVHTTQNHYAAAVDLLVLANATVAVCAHYSTFKLAVFARACPPNAPKGTRGVFTYDISSRGDFSALRYADCSEAAPGWAGHVLW